MIARLSPMNRFMRAVVVALLLVLLGCTDVRHSDAANNAPANSNAADTSQVTMENPKLPASIKLDPRRFRFNRGLKPTKAQPF